MTSAILKDEVNDKRQNQGMEIRATDTPRVDWTGDTLALGFFEDAVELTGDLAQLDQKLSGTLKELIEETEFKGSVGSSAVTRVGAGSSVRKVILVGLGKSDTLTVDSLRRVAAAIARMAKQQKSKTLGVSLPAANNDTALSAQAIAEGITLALHLDNRFKSEPEDKGAKLEQVELLGLGDVQAAINQGNAICQGVILARELVAAPPNSVTPMTLAQTAQDIASAYGMTLEVLEKDECEKLGMGAFLGVAQASEMPPKFIHLTYKPEGTPRRKVAIVGKGLTFDSGGLNLKELLEKQQEILEQSEAFQKQPLCISTRVKQLGYDDLTKGDYQQIGKIVKKIYVQKHDGINPPQREQYTYKAKCSVNCYYGYDRHIIDKAIYQYVENKKAKIQDNQNIK